MKDKEDEAKDLYNSYKLSTLDIQITQPIFYTHGTLCTNEYTINGITYSYNYSGQQYHYSNAYINNIAYKELVDSEKHLVDNIDSINKMLESTDTNTVLLAVGIVKEKTKWLGLYLEAHWILKNDYIKSIILEQFVLSKHGKL